jgi:hypothetical protein
MNNNIPRNNNTENNAPRYNNSGRTFSEKLANILTYMYKFFNFFILGYINLHRPEFLFILSLFIYIITVTIVFTKNPYEFINSDNHGLTIFISILGAFLIIMGFVFYNKKKALYENETDVNTLSYMGKLLTSFISLFIVIGILYFIFYMSAEYSNFSTFLIYAINLTIFFGLIALAIRFFGLSSGIPKESKPSWLGLLYKMITYIPCLILQVTDYINVQYQITSKPILLLLAIEVILITSYLIFPWVMDTLMNHNALQLVKYPSKINKENNIGTFQNINYKDDKFQYKYAVSGWIYLDSFPPETNPNYDEFTSLLNIGNKPNVQFNVLKNKLKIITQTEGKNEQILYKTKQFKMQRWNHIVINYDGQSMDIFINNELVSTNPGIIPYNDNTEITTGSNDGLHGGICNVMYYNDSITRNKISWLYNSVNYLNPPVI